MSQLKYKHYFTASLKLSPTLEEPHVFQREFEGREGKRGYLIVHWEDEETLIDAEDLRFYFKVYISVIATHHAFYGFSKTKIHHEMMRLKFGEILVISGEEQEWYPSITSLSKKEFREYIQWLELFMKDTLDIEPLPPRKLKF